MTGLPLWDDVCRNRHGGADTSVEAFRKSDLTRARKLVFGTIAESGARGITCEEIELKTGMKHQTASARITELRKMNLIVDTWIRRPTTSGCSARVYVTAEAILETENDC